jgi:hypothetical protein
MSCAPLLDAPRKIQRRREKNQSRVDFFNAMALGAEKKPWGHCGKNSKQLPN